MNISGVTAVTVVPEKNSARKPKGTSRKSDLSLARVVATETSIDWVQMMFQGGTDDFATNLFNWLKRLAEGYDGQTGLGPFEFYEPDQANIVVVASSTEFSGRAFELLKLARESGEEAIAGALYPSGLYEAILPVLTPGADMIQYTVPGIEFETFDTARRTMALEDRRVGKTPRQLARAGGW